MQITLTQADIEMAISNYVSEMGITRPITEITFTQSRNPTLVSAEIHLLPLANKGELGLAKAHTAAVKEAVPVHVAENVPVDNSAEAEAVEGPVEVFEADVAEEEEQANVKSLFS